MMHQILSTSLNDNTAFSTFFYFYIIHLAVLRIKQQYEQLLTMAVRSGVF